MIRSDGPVAFILFHALTGGLCPLDQWKDGDQWEELIACSYYGGIIIDFACRDDTQTKVIEDPGKQTNE
jgi:hypothetical protein